MADNTEIVHEIVMGDGKKIKVKKSDWDAMSDKYINKFGDGRLLMTDKKGNKGYIPLSSYNDALEKGMHATRMGADLNQYSRVMSNYKDKYISQGNDNMSRPASTQQTRQTQVQTKAVQVAQQRPVASRQQAVQSAQAQQTKQVRGQQAPQAQQTQPRQATQGRQVQSKVSTSGVLKTAKLRRGGKDYEIPWQEINAEGGLGKYIANHNSKEAPIRVYMRDAKGKLFHVDARQVNNYRGKGYKFEVGKAKRWQPTVSEKAAMIAEWQEMADNTKDVMRGYQRSANRAVGLPEDWESNGKVNYEQGHAAIEQEKNRRKAAVFGAQLQGIDTKPMGLFSGGGLSGANGGEKASSQQGQSPFAMANAKSPEVNRVVMKDGKPTVEWVLPDGSVTTDIMEADKAEYYARKERGRRSGEAELRNMGLNPLSPMAISTQQAWKNLTNEWGEKQAAQIREMLGNSDATKQAWEITDQLYKEADGEMKAAAKRNDEATAAITGIFGEDQEQSIIRQTERLHKNYVDYLTLYDLMDMSDKVWGMMDEDKKDELRKTAREQGYTSAEDIEKYARAKSDEVVYDYAKRRNAPKNVLDLFVRNVINANTVTSLAKGLMRMGTKKQGDLDAIDMAYAEYGKEHPGWNIAGNVFGVGFDPVTWVSGWVGGKAGKFALSLYGRRLEKMYQLAKGAGKGIAAAKGTGKLLAGVAGGAGNFATFEAGGEIKQQIEKGGAVGDDGRVHGYSAGRVIGAAAKGAGMGAVMGGGSHYISKGAAKAISKADNVWGKAGIASGRTLTNTLWSATVLSIPEWINGEQSPMDVWLENIGTMGGFGLMHGIKAAPRVIRELAPVKNPTTAAERLHNRTSFMERVDNVLSAGTVDTWLTQSDYTELMANGYGDFYDLFKARDKEGFADTKTKYSTDPKTQEYKDAFVRMEEFVKDERVSQRLRSKMYSMLTGRGLPISGYTRAEYGETPEGEGYVATYTPDSRLVTFDIYKTLEEARVESEKKRKTCQRVAVGYAEDYAESQYHDKVLEKSLLDTWKELYPDAEAPEVRMLVAKYYAAIAKPREELAEEDAAFLDHLNRQIISNHKEYEDMLPETAREEISRKYGVDVDEALRKGIDKQTARERDAIAEYVQMLAKDIAERNSRLLPESERGTYDTTGESDGNNGGGEAPEDDVPPVEPKPVEPTDPNVGNERNEGNVGNEGNERGVSPADIQPEQSKVSARMQAAIDEYNAALEELTRFVGEENAYKIINEIGAKEYLDYLKGEGISSGAEFDAVNRLIAADEAIDQINRDTERDLGYQSGKKAAEQMTDEELAAELMKASEEANDSMPTEFNLGYLNAISDTLRDRQKEAVEEKELPTENEPNRPNGANEANEGNEDLPPVEDGAQVSDETNEFGKPFILSSDGTTTFGSIQEDSGLKAAPIKLSLGENFVDENGINHGYGLLHIEAGHGKQIKDAGFSTIEEFVETVAKNYDTIREGGIIANNQTYLLEISDKHNNTLFIQLSRDGNYWNINSAGIFKTKYSRRKPEVFTRPALKTETNTDSSGVNSGQLSGVTAPAGNSPQTSDGKGSESFSKKQGIAGNGSTLSRVPVDENGEPRFEAVDSATGWDALVEMIGNEDGAKTIAEAQADQAGKDVAAIRKREPQKGKVKLTGSVTAMAEAYKNTEKKYEEDHAAWESEMSAAVSKHERWQALAAEPEVRRKAAEEAEAKRKAEEEERARAEEAERRRKAAELAAEQAAAAGAPIDWNTWPNWTDEPPAEGRNRGGFRRDGSALVRRQGKVEGVPGKETSSKFATEVIVPGQYMVIEADDIQPSHIQGQSNPLHFITEAQPKDRKDVVSVASAQKIASNVRPEEITSAVTAYTGVPTVNARGEVIQGNNRADALKILGGYTESAERYKQYLIDHAADFGIDPEAVAKMKNPVLVNRLDVSDGEAIRLGQYTQKDIESGGDERIDPGTTLTKMGDKVQSFTNILFQGSADQDMSISELISANGHEALRWLLDHGCISDNQYTSALNEKGDLNADAKVDIRNIMVANLFNGAPQSLKEKFGELPAAAQKALMETVYRDMYSESDRKIMPEIHKSIEVFSELMKIPAFNEARNVEMAIKALQDYVRQYTFDEVTGEMVLPSDKFSNFALHLAALYKGAKQRDLRALFNRFYDNVQGKVEASLFEEADTEIKTITDAIKIAFGIDYKPIKAKEDGNGSNGVGAVGVDNNGGPSGERGGGNDAKGGELLPEGDGKTDGGRGDQGDSGKGEGRGVGIGQVERGNGGVSEDGDGKTDNQGNPLNADGTLKLEKITSIDELRDEDFSAPTRNVELPALPRNVDEAIGANGKPVIIKKNVFEKNKSSHKDLTTDDSRKILSHVLYNPNLYGQNQKATRPYNWILVHLANKNKAVVVEVNDNKDNIEIVNWHYLTDKTLEQKKRQAVKEGSLILTLESAAGNTLNDLSSGGKGNTLSSEKQDADAKNGDGVEDYAEMDEYVPQTWDESSSLRDVEARLKLLEDAFYYPWEALGKKIFPEYIDFINEKGDLKDKYGSGDKVPKEEADALFAKYAGYIERYNAMREEIYSLRELRDRLEAKMSREQKEEESRREMAELLAKHNGYLRGMSNLRMWNVDRYLSKLKKIDGEVATVSEFIDRWLADGSLRISKREYKPQIDRRKWNRMSGQEQAAWEASHNKPKTEYLVNDYDLGKTAYDYARWLLSQKNKGKLGGGKPQERSIVEENGGDVVKEQKSAGTGEVSPREAALRDSLIGVLRDAGVEVVTDVAEGQRVLDKANGDARVQAKIGENEQKLRQHKVYHGSGADFDAFDHNHMSEGEGAQAYGWGAYVTEVEAIGRNYAIVNNNSLRKSKLESDIYRLKEALPFRRGEAKREGEEELKRLEEELSKFNTDWRSVLYTVEIPDDTGSNYLHWDKPVGREKSDKISKALYDRILREDKDGLYKDEYSRAALRRELDSLSDTNGKDLYGTISVYLGGDKATSEFLRDNGFVGVSYPSQYRSGGRKDGARNYVVFDEKDMEITDKVKFFRRGDGEAYGYTVDGKIYIDPRIATAETPIHEYSHLWSAFMRKANPKAWGDIVKLMKECTDIWDQVTRDYPELKTEDDIAEEVLTHYSGRRGAERLRAEMQRAMESADKDAKKQTMIASMFEGVRRALSRFWRGVADLFHIRFTSAEDVADRVLADMLNGFNPVEAGKKLGERAGVAEVKDSFERYRGRNPRARQLSLFDDGFKAQPEARQLSLFDDAEVDGSGRIIEPERQAEMDRNAEKVNSSLDEFTDEYAEYLRLLDETEGSEDFVPEEAEARVMDLRDKLVEDMMEYHRSAGMGEAEARKRSWELVNQTMTDINIALLRKGKSGNIELLPEDTVKVKRMNESEEAKEWLPELGEGEFCYMERKFSEDKSFVFSAPEHIESMDDVAYIFKQLEKYSVEHSFLALVKDGKVTVVHLGMGNATSAIVNMAAARAALDKFDPDMVYFVHNHPSGVLTASIPDVDSLQTLRDMTKGKVECEALIIDTLSGKYAQFGLGGHSRILDLPKGYDNEVEVKVQAHDKMEYAPDFTPDNKKQVLRAESVAKYVSSLRVGTGDKVGVLVMNQQNHILANLYLPMEEDMRVLGDDIAGKVVRFGGNRVIVYTNNGQMLEVGKTLEDAIKRRSGKSVLLLDVLRLKKDGDYQALSESVFEAEGEYGGNAHDIAISDRVAQREYLLSDNYVSSLKGEEFDKSDKPLTERVAQFYAQKFDGKVERKGLGTVILDKRGVKDSLSHGIGRNKAAAFAAVPDIICNGVLIDQKENWKNRKYDSYTIAAPIEIAGEGFVGVAIVTRGHGTNANRFYLHEVVLQKNLLDESIKTDTKADSHRGDVAKVLKEIVTAKGNGENVIEDSARYRIGADEAAAKSGDGYNGDALGSASTSEEEMRGEAERLSAELNTPVRIITDAEGAASLPTVRQRRAKGFWSEKDGIVVVLSNHKDVADVAGTVLHEIVGHDGLRVLFPEKEKLDNALDELYGVSHDNIRTEIDSRTDKIFKNEVDRIMERKRKEHETKGEDATANYLKDLAEAHAEAEKKRSEMRREATEEYGADLADRIGEDGFKRMDAEEATFWGKFKAMLQKAFDSLLQGLRIKRGKKWTDK